MPALAPHRPVCWACWARVSPSLDKPTNLRRDCLTRIKLFLESRCLDAIKYQLDVAQGTCLHSRGGAGEGRGRRQLQACTVYHAAPINHIGYDSQRFQRAPVAVGPCLPIRAWIACAAPRRHACAHSTRALQRHPCSHPPRMDRLMCSSSSG